MGILKRANGVMVQEDAKKTRLQQRISRIPTGDLQSWAEQSLYNVGRSLIAWQREGREENLLEAEQAAEATLELVQELRDRVSLPR